MSLATFRARLDRIARKTRRRTIKRNVKAYRVRQRQAGNRRLEITVSREQFAALRARMQPGDTFGAAIGRLLEAISGNTKPEEKPLMNQGA